MEDDATMILSRSEHISTARATLKFIFHIITWCYLVDKSFRNVKKKEKMDEAKEIWQKHFHSISKPVKRCAREYRNTRSTLAIIIPLI